MAVCDDSPREYLWANHESTEIKRTPMIIGDLLWKPFDVRFQEILERITLRQKVVNEELQLCKLNEIQSSIKKASQTSNDALEEMRIATEHLGRAKDRLGGIAQGKVLEHLTKPRN